MISTSVNPLFFVVLIFIIYRSFVCNGEQISRQLVNMIAFVLLCYAASLPLLYSDQYTPTQEQSQLSCEPNENPPLSPGVWLSRRQETPGKHAACPDNPLPLFDCWTVPPPSNCRPPFTPATAAGGMPAAKRKPGISSGLDWQRSGRSRQTA
jgi:hypothetical protein